MKTLIDHRFVGDIPVLEFYNPEIPTKLPLVIILHGFTGKKEDHFTHGYALAREGYYAVSTDLHLHGELGNAPFLPSAVTARFVEVLKESLENLETLISVYTQSDNINQRNIGLMGISLGGAVIYSYLPNRAPNIKAAVTMVAGPSPLAEVTFTHIQKLYTEFGVTDELIRSFAHISRTSSFLENVSDFPLLMQYGELDPLIPITGIRRLYHEVRSRYTERDRIKLLEYANTGHETPNAMFIQAIQWFQTHLNNA